MIQDAKLFSGTHFLSINVGFESTRDSLWKEAEGEICVFLFSRKLRALDEKSWITPDLKKLRKLVQKFDRPKIFDLNVVSFSQL